MCLLATASGEKASGVSYFDVDKFTIFCSLTRGRQCSVRLERFNAKRNKINKVKKNILAKFVNLSAGYFGVY